MMVVTIMLGTQNKDRHYRLERVVLALDVDVVNKHVIGFCLCAPPSFYSHQCHGVIIIMGSVNLFTQKKKRKTQIENPKNTPQPLAEENVRQWLCVSDSVQVSFYI